MLEFLTEQLFLVSGRIYLIPHGVSSTEVPSLYLPLDITVDQVAVCRKYHTFSLVPNVHFNFAYDYWKLQFYPLAIG